MSKNRLERPFDNFWRDDKGMWHRCHYLFCDDGCGCETEHFRISYLEGAIERLKEVEAEEGDTNG